jgi:hypothetical protein
VPAIKLDIDTEAYERLVERAVLWRRPVDWQAEVELRQALGLPFPREAGDELRPTDTRKSAAAVAATT